MSAPVVRPVRVVPEAFAYGRSCFEDGYELSPELLEWARLRGWKESLRLGYLQAQKEKREADRN